MRHLFKAMVFACVAIAARSAAAAQLNTAVMRSGMAGRADTVIIRQLITCSFDKIWATTSDSAIIHHPRGSWAVRDDPVLALRFL